MRSKLLAAATVAVLLAAAFFLPERLLIWGDGQLLDILQIDSRSEEREGFAERLQLTVPEKILLLRSGTLTVMELDRTVLERVTYGESANTALFYITEERQALRPVSESPDLKASTEEELERYTEETGQLWEARLTEVRSEVRSLQALGGLPELWKTGSQPDYIGYGNLLYLDPDSRISFQVYQMTLRWESCDLELLVDVESGRILSFALRWTQDGTPNWGPRGASGFGSAWRDYWGMDSVSTGWYNEYTRNVLENVESQAAVNGDYAAHDQITFLYDGQSLAIPLECRGTRSWNFSITWNR